MKKGQLYLKKKRRFFGGLLQEAEATAPNAWLAIHCSSKDLLSTYESSGLVVSINGGGSTDAGHPDVDQARAVVAAVMERGGIVLSGGRTTGVMAASAEAPKGRAVGVIFPELRSESQEGPVAIVNSPTSRTELLATCAPIVIVFRGGIGTFSVLLRAMIHQKNFHYHPEQPPQLLFVNDYWVGLLTTMVNMGAVPADFISGIVFFHDAAAIIKRIPAV